MNYSRKLWSREYFPFLFALALNLGFLTTAFAVDSPEAVIGGFLRIIQTRSILITDYIAVGGIGATLLNVSLVGILSVLGLIRLGVKPNGVNIMALCMSIGFAFFGKNVFNMIPLTFGVWLFSRYRRAPFSDYYLAAMLVATLSPTISEIAFMGAYSRAVEISAGVLLGFFVGFIFPAISAASHKVHRGYNLYNMGFAGGLIATMLATGLRSVGLEIVPVGYWSQGNNHFFAWLLYAHSLVMIAVGFLMDTKAGSLKGRIRNRWQGFLKIHKHCGRLVTDFYYLYENSIYINMGVLCISATTLVLLLGADLNGPTIAGILTMMAFGSLGKHMGNVTPIMIGAIVSAYVNRWDPTSPNNILAILFSTGLAPVAGTFGWAWGIVAGFLHLNIASYIGDLNSGLNLYNNGFAATFVVMFLLPIIIIFKQDPHTEKDEHR